MLIRLIEVFVLGSIKTCSPLINVEALLTSISFLYLSWSILSQEFAEYRYTFYKTSYLLDGLMTSLKIYIEKQKVKGCYFV